MTELTKQEQLEKAVVDTKAAWDDDKAAFDYSFNKAAWDAAAEDAAADAIYAIYKAATYAAWSKAKRELEDYLEEQDDEHSN